MCVYVQLPFVFLVFALKKKEFNVNRLLLSIYTMPKSYFFSHMHNMGFYDSYFIKQVSKFDVVILLYKKGLQDFFHKHKVICH